MARRIFRCQTITWANGYLSSIAPRKPHCAVHQWSESKLVLVLAWRLFDAKPLPNQLFYMSLNLLDLYSAVNSLRPVVHHVGKLSKNWFWQIQIEIQKDFIATQNNSTFYIQTQCMIQYNFEINTSPETDVFFNCTGINIAGMRYTLLILSQSTFKPL